MRASQAAIHRRAVQTTPTKEDRRREYNRRYYLKRKSGGPHATERRLLLSVRLRATLLARLRRLVNEGIATGKFPYRTMQDAVEDLLVRGVGTMKGDDTVDEMLPHFEVMQHIDRVAMLRQEAMSVLTRAKTEITELRGIGADTEALQYFAMTLDNVERLPETAWRDWLLR